MRYEYAPEKRTALMPSARSSGATLAKASASRQSETMGPAPTVQ
jgi:hypothetical protein